MKIGLYTRYLSPAFGDELKQLAAALQRREVTTVEVDGSLGEEELDFLFSIGGDGTLLSAVHLLAGRAIPVVGINFGHPDSSPPQAATTSTSWPTTSWQAATPWNPAPCCMWR